MKLKTERKPTLQHHTLRTKPQIPTSPSESEALQSSGRSGAAASPARASDSTKRRKVTSQRKIAANRRNAQQSTGPRTARGKKIVSRNALKHGLLARAVVITGGEGEEDQQEFETVLARIAEYYQPVGAMEEMFVELIATYWWRLGRVLRAENGELQKRLHSAKRDSEIAIRTKGSIALSSVQSVFDAFQSQESTKKELNKWMQRHGLHPAILESCSDEFDPETRERIEWLANTQNELKKHWLGATHISTLLKIAKLELTVKGYISKTGLELLDSVLGYSDSFFMFALSTCAKDEEKGSERKADDQSNHSLRDAVVRALDDMLMDLNVCKHYAVQDQSLEIEAETRSRSLPPPEVTDKILRYEGQIERQLHRAIHQLERLQRRRLGENVPPPLDVNLGI